MSTKRSLLVLFSLLAFAVGGCSTLNMGESTTSVSSSPVADQIVARGEIRVGMSGNQPPFNMKNRAGKLIGMDVDLARALARTMGVEAKLVTMPFKDLLPALEKGEIDIVMSGMTMTSERNLGVAFAGPYFVSGKAALTKEPSLAAAAEPADVNKPVRMSVLAGSTSELFVKRELAEVEMVAAADYDEAVQMVLDGDVDAMIADYPVTILELFRHPNAGLVTTISTFSFEPIGVAIAPGSHLLQNVVQNYFTLLEGTGMLERLRLAWFDNSDWLAELPEAK
jgi:polar amino acid transport system substrate-binding protein